MLDASNLAGFFSSGIILLGALIYYFGTVIGSTKVEEYDKIGFYLEGVFFIIPYLLFPFVIITLMEDYFVQNPEFLSNQRLIFNDYSLWLLLIQLFLSLCLGYNITLNTYLKRYELLEKTKNTLAESFNLKIENFKENGFQINKSFQVFSHRLVGIFVFLLYTIPMKIFGNKILLWIFSFLIISITYYYFKIETSLQTIALSLLLSFLALTYIAISVGFISAYYPPARIRLNNGDKIEGKVLKFGKFVHLITYDKKYLVNSSQISYVEESLSKEKLHDSKILNNGESATHAYSSEDAPIASNSTE